MGRAKYKLLGYHTETKKKYVEHSGISPPVKGTKILIELG